MSTYWRSKDHVLSDWDKMPFGKHKGAKMQDVPGKYLQWLGEQEWIGKWPKVKAYIIAKKKAIDRDTIIGRAQAPERAREK